MDNFYKVAENEIKYNLINLKQLVFEVTGKCNLNCKYCGYSDLYIKSKNEEKRNKRNLSFKQAKAIIDYLYTLWESNMCADVFQQTYISFYGGEPLINMALIKKIVGYIESLKPVGRFFIYSMTTNAILLKKHMDYLAEKDFKLLISLDGDERGHSYRTLHNNENSFKYVYSNIKCLQLKYPEYFNQSVNFNSVLHNRNDVELIYDYILDEFDKTPNISPLNTSGISKEKFGEFKNIYQTITDSINHSCDQESLKNKLFTKNPETYFLIDYFFYRSGNIYNSYSDLLFDKSRMATYPTGTCSPFYKKMYIAVDGKILSCEKINPDFYFGQISNNKVELDLLSVAEKHNKYIFRFISNCYTCARNKKCPLCIYTSDDIHKQEPKCERYTTINELEKSINNGLKYLKKHPYLYRKILKELTISQ